MSLGCLDNVDLAEDKTTLMNPRPEKPTSPEISQSLDNLDFSKATPLSKTPKVEFNKRYIT